MADAENYDTPLPGELPADNALDRLRLLHTAVRDVTLMMTTSGGPGLDETTRLEVSRRLQSATLDLDTYGVEPYRP